MRDCGIVRPRAWPRTRGRAAATTSRTANPTSVRELMERLGLTRARPSPSPPAAARTPCPSPGTSPSQWPSAPGLADLHDTAKAAWLAACTGFELTGAAAEAGAGQRRSAGGGEAALSGELRRLPAYSRTHRADW